MPQQELQGGKDCSGTTRSMPHTPIRIELVFHNFLTSVSKSHNFMKVLSFGVLPNLTFNCFLEQIHNFNKKDDGN